MAWWNSLDAVSLVSSIARWAGAVIAIIVLILGHRLNRLQKLAKSEEQKKSEEALAEARNIAVIADKKQTPRSVSLLQASKFVEILKAAPKGKVMLQSYGNADPGTIKYAHEIRDMVMAAGYSSVGMMMNIDGGTLPEGMFFAIKDNKACPPFAGIMLRAFTDCGFSIKGCLDNSIAPDEVKIYVGLKPQE